MKGRDIWILEGGRGRYIGEGCDGRSMYIVSLRYSIVNYRFSIKNLILFTEIEPKSNLFKATNSNNSNRKKSLEKLGITKISYSLNSNSSPKQ